MCKKGGIRNGGRPRSSTNCDISEQVCRFTQRRSRQPAIKIVVRNDVEADCCLLDFTAYGIDDLNVKTVVKNSSFLYLHFENLLNR